MNDYVLGISTYVFVAFAYYAWAVRHLEPKLAEDVQRSGGWWMVVGFLCFLWPIMIPIDIITLVLHILTPKAK